MTRSERIAMWTLVAGLVAHAYFASSRIDTLTGQVSRLAEKPSTILSTPSSTTTAPLEAAVAELRRQVSELRATRGLSGPEVRRLVETLLPAPGCVEPPCGTAIPPATGGTAPVATASVKR